MTEKIVDSEFVNPNKDKSHWGFPREEASHAHYIEARIPDVDSFQIFGFNQLIHNDLKNKSMRHILTELGVLNHSVAAAF